MPATVKNRTQKSITITICNQMLLKLSDICENEINDKAQGSHRNSKTKFHDFSMTFPWSTM